MNVFTLSQAGRLIGERRVLADVTLAAPPDAKIGIIGRNGAGKSTLLRIIGGLDTPTDGAAALAPDTRVGILEQDPALDEASDVCASVEHGVADIRSMLARYDALATALGAAADDTAARLLDELGTLQERLDLAGGWDLDARIAQAMDALRCPPPDTPVRTLSGGERRRVALAQVLVAQPDLLLLDEPTNHLDAESVQWLEAHLGAYAGAVVAVTHDRYFLDNVAKVILELDRGRVHRYDGNYATYLAAKTVRLKVEGQRDAKLQRRLAEELAWARADRPSRHATAKARVSHYDQLAADANRTTDLDFDEIQIPPGPRLGTLVLEATGLRKGFGGSPLIENLSFSLPRGGIVGVLGPNGAGKTTLFKLMAGYESPDAGTLRLGETVTVSYVDQARTGLDPTLQVWQAVAGGEDYVQLGARQMPCRAYVASFGFKGADQQKPVGTLSGGEMNRLHLALTLKRGGNLLLLDEPTNDLDVETLASLERALLTFPGCVVVTAHDRWFLDRIATHTLAWEHDATWAWYEGNFADYLENKTERLGPATALAHHGVHRKLARN